VLVRSLCLVAAVLVAAAPSRAGAQAPPTDYTLASGATVGNASDSTDADFAAPVLVELRVGRLAARTVQAFRVRDDALLPVGALFDLAEVEHHLSPEGRMDATLPDGSVALRIDVASDTMRAGTRRVVPDRSLRLVRDGELYVASIPLGTLLGVHFAVDWQELVVTLLDPGQLPVARRAERDAAHQRFSGRGATRATPPDLMLGLSRPSVDGLVLDYALSAHGDRPLQTGSYALALGVDVLGGSLEGALQNVGPAGDGRSRGTLSWTGVWNDASVVRQLRLGDALSSGPSPRPLRGISFGNAPYLRLTDFGTAEFLGDVAPGWLVEAYRGGELIAFDSTNAAGQFGLQLPVEYGENAIDLVAFGPERGLHAIGVAAGCGLAQCECADGLAAGQPRQPALLLPGIAPAQQGRRHHHVHRDQAERRGAGPAQRLAYFAELARVQSKTALRSRDRHAEQARARARRQHVGRKLAGEVEGVGASADRGVDPRPQARGRRDLRRHVVGRCHAAMSAPSLLPTKRVKASTLLKFAMSMSSFSTVMPKLPSTCSTSCIANNEFT